MRFAYSSRGDQVQIETSDGQAVTYRFVLSNGHAQLTQVVGSHCMPISYEYQDLLVKKVLPEGRFLEIEYRDGKVLSLKGPGESALLYTFSYGPEHSDVFNAVGLRTRYLYDQRFQLVEIERYDEHNQLYRTEKKVWGATKPDAGLLLAKMIADGNGRTLSYRSFQYDRSGNVTEERLYGNLTGREEVSLEVSPEGMLIDFEEVDCHRRSFGYSTDGFNLLTRVGDCKGNETLYFYKPRTHLLTKKLIFDKGTVGRRSFYSYNEDGVCIRSVEDDGSEADDEDDYWDVTERHIKVIKPRESLPGVGLPEVIEERALDLKTEQEVLVKRLVNTYDKQSHLIACSLYDANGQYVSTEKCSYNSFGQVISQIDAMGREVRFTYDKVGNQLSRSLPQDGKSLITTYDIHNQPLKIIETTPERQWEVANNFDCLGRKIQSTDRFGNTTYYRYDEFDRLIEIIHPVVLNEKGQSIAPTFKYTYDIFGNVLTMEDPEGFVTEKCYNLRGDPTRVRYPDGTFELFKYDPEGSLHRSFTREQLITVYEYDYLGRSIYEECSTSNETGVASFLFSRSRQYTGFHCVYEREADHLKRYQFDVAGRLSALIEGADCKNEESPEMRRTEFVYSPVGRVAQKRVWFGSWPDEYALECFEYDLVGNVIEKRVEDAQGKVLLRRAWTARPMRMTLWITVFEWMRKSSSTTLSINWWPLHKRSSLTMRRAIS